MPKYAEVILPLPLYTTFCYSVPDDLLDKIFIGTRVLVQFGKKKFYTCVVASFSDNPPGNFQIKPIMSVLDTKPILKYPQLKHWAWIADYYLSSIGDVYKAAVPSGLKPESETWLSLNPDFEPDDDFKLSDHQLKVVQALEKEKKMRLSDLQNATFIKNIGNVAGRLLEKGIVEIAEQVSSSYRPKVQRMISLNANPGEADKIHVFFEAVKRSKKQEKLLVSFLGRTNWHNPRSKPLPIPRDELLKDADVSAAVLRALIDKGIFSESKETFNRFAPKNAGHNIKLAQLSSAQNIALNQIRSSFIEKNVCLLHGATGSGKTEVYTHLINEAFQNGNQVLFLVPEISLTTQLTDRLRRVFGDNLLVYHSKFNDSERVDIYKRLLSSSDPIIVVGTRSSVFLPFFHLGLVVVDEEHESSYKQYDPAPRYNARDAAIVLASMHGAKTLLGSASPSVETYWKAQNGKYGLVSLSERFGDVPLPKVEIVDMKAQRKQKMNRGIFSRQLLNLTNDTLSKKRQAIFFLNRRGFAPMVVCSQCGWTPKCPNCDISPVYHKFGDSLRCHYCGFSQPLPAICPACGENAVEVYGYGTERISEEVEANFPNHIVERMDLDTTRNKDAYQQIISRFSKQQTDILVGTQMVTKGLDFAAVDIVGVLNADTLLNFPDFRSNERAFNMLEQVAGRAGRRDANGKVVIQTVNPDNNILDHVKNHDFQAYYNEEIEQRRLLGYPPFTRIINVYIKNKDERIAEEAARKYATALRQVFGDRVLGPDKPLVARIATFWLQSIMLKVEANASMKKVKHVLRDIYEALARDPMIKSSVIYYDVDPM